MIHTPFAALTDAKMASPVGPDNAYSLRLTASPFIQSIQVVNAAGSVPNAPPSSAGAIDALKPDQVTGTAMDARATATLAGRIGGYATNALGGLGAAATALTASLDPARITGSTTLAKNWTTTAVGTEAIAGISSWSLFAGATSAAVEFRAITPSTTVSNPFPAGVAIIRRRYDAVTVPAAMTSEQDYLGMATFGGVTVDNNGIKTWKWTFAPAAVVQGNGITRAGYSTNDEIRAIGLDASGNGLATATQPVSAGVLSYALLSATNSAGVIVTPAKTFVNSTPANLWTFFDYTSTSGTATERALNISEGSSTADPVILKAGTRLLLNGGTAVAGYGAGAVTYTCVSSDASIATVSGTQACTVIPHATNVGVATIFMTATATAAGATLPTSVSISTFVEVRAGATWDATTTTSAANITTVGTTSAGWAIYDTYNAAGFLVRAQRASFNPGQTDANTAKAVMPSSSAVQAVCYSTFASSMTVRAPVATTVNPTTYSPTCTVTRNSSVAGSTAAATFGTAASGTFTVAMLSRMTANGNSLFSNPVRTAYTAVALPATAATLFSATNAPSLSGVAGVAVPVSVNVVDQFGTGLNGVTLTLTAGTNVTCSPDDVVAYSACNTITVTTAGAGAVASATAPGTATFYVKPSATGSTALDIAVTNAYFNSTGLLAYNTIPQSHTATVYGLTGTAVNSTTVAGSGTITTTGVADTYIPNAGSYSFTMSGLTAVAGATATYTCALYTAATNGTLVTTTVSPVVTGTTCAIGALTVLTSNVDLYVEVGGSVSGTGLTTYTATAPARFKVIRTQYAGLGTLSHTGTFPRNLADAGQPYSFTMSGLTAHSGAGYTYGCQAYTTTGGAGQATPVVSTKITATSTVANGVYTCTLTPNGAAGSATPVYVELTGSALGGTMTTWVATAVEVVVNRIP